jgi:predicted Zn-dependent protease
MTAQDIVDLLKSDPQAIAALQNALTAATNEWQNIAQAARSLGMSRKKLDALIDAGILKGALRDVSDPLKSYRSIQVNVPAADQILRDRVA